MLERLVILGAVLVALVAVIAIVFLLGMRAKSPLVLRPLVLLQRAVINPRQMRSAGSPGAYASVIRHHGRVSGRSYETPVDAVPTDEGFVVALVYGSRTSWLRNVIASGSATIVHEGQTYEVDRPEMIPMRSVADRFTPGDRRGFRWLAVDEALLLRRVEPAAVHVRSTVAVDAATTGAPLADEHQRIGAGQGASPPKAEAGVD